MEVSFHRLIQKDLRSALDYYETEGGEILADRFFEDVESTVERITGNPRLSHFVEGDFRRAALTVFPYHFLYKESGNRIKILVLRHDKRHPSFGLRRQL